ncbi:DUF922 domain-containing protein [Agrobacterium vitis]|nr:DUF922 domain-containing protein [Agrobacterium vitis]
MSWIRSMTKRKGTLVCAALVSRVIVSGMVLAVFGTAGMAQAETIVRKSTVYFPIGGRTATDLDHELERKGPHTVSTGTRHPGATRIRFGGTMDYVRRNGRCAIGNIKVTVSIKVIVPRWKNRHSANPQLGLIWDTLSADINRHESRHAEIAVQHARELDQKLKALPSATSCEELQEEVSVLTDQVTQEHDADQLRFDRIEAVNFNDRIMRLLKYRYTKTQAHHD